MAEIVSCDHSPTSVQAGGGSFTFEATVEMVNNDFFAADRVLEIEVAGDVVASADVHIPVGGASNSLTTTLSTTLAGPETNASLPSEGTVDVEAVIYGQSDGTQDHRVFCGTLGIQPADDGSTGEVAVTGCGFSPQVVTSGAGPFTIQAQVALENRGSGERTALYELHVGGQRVGTLETVTIPGGSTGSVTLTAEFDDPAADPRLPTPSTTSTSVPVSVVEASDLPAIPGFAPARAQNTKRARPQSTSMATAVTAPASSAATPKARSIAQSMVFSQSGSSCGTLTIQPADTGGGGGGGGQQPSEGGLLDQLPAGGAGLLLILAVVGVLLGS